MSSFYTSSSYDIFDSVQLDIDRLVEAERRKESYEKVVEYLVKQDLASSFVNDPSQAALSDIHGLSSNPMFLLDQSPFSQEPLQLTHFDEDVEADVPASWANDSMISVAQRLYQIKLEAGCLPVGPLYALRPVTMGDRDVTSEVHTEPNITRTPGPPSLYNNPLLAPQPTRPHCQPDAVCLLVEPQEQENPEPPVRSEETEAAGHGLHSADPRTSEERDLEASTWCSRAQSSQESLIAVVDLAESEDEETNGGDESQLIACDLNGSGTESGHPLEIPKKRKPSKEKMSCPYPECKHSTKRPHDLKRHIRSVHTGEKKYVCQWPGCEAGFVRSEPLKIHYLSHAGVRPLRSAGKRKGASKRTYRRKRNLSIKL